MIPSSSSQWLTTPFAVALVVGIIGSFGAGSGAQSAAPKEITQPFSIFISTATAAVTAGSDMSITVRLTNTSDHDMRITRAFFGGTDASYTQEIRNSKGALATRETSGAVHTTLAGSFSAITLKPGESSAGSIGVSPQYDLSQPGEYVLQLSRPISANPSDGVVKSNKIKIIVTP
jgi:hypothetical protein